MEVEGLLVDVEEAVEEIVRLDDAEADTVLEDDRVALSVAEVLDDRVDVREAVAVRDEIADAEVERVDVPLAVWVGVAVGVREDLAETEEDGEVVVVFDSRLEGDPDREIVAVFVLEEVPVEVRLEVAVLEDDEELVGDREEVEDRVEVEDVVDVRDATAEREEERLCLGVRLARAESVDVRVDEADAVGRTPEIQRFLSIATAFGSYIRTNSVLFAEFVSIGGPSP